MNSHFKSSLYRASLLFMLSSLYSFAEAAEEIDTPPVSSITLNMGQDTDKNINRQLQLNIELTNYHQISTGYGDSTSSLSLFNTSQYFIGLATNPYNSFSIGTEYNQWGKNNGLEVRTLKSDVFINLSQWSFSLSPQISIATFYGNGENTSKTSNLDSKGISISASYYGFKQYFFGANYFVNQFEENLFFTQDQVLTNFTLSRISESAQLLISGLEKHHEGISAGRFFDWGSIEIDWIQSQAALVANKSNTTSLIIDYQLTNQLSLSLIASQQRLSGDNSALNALDLGLTIYW